MKTETLIAHKTLASNHLALLLMLALPAAVQAQFSYATNNGAITITSYSGSGGSVIIPGAIYGLPVTSIGDFAFIGAGFTNVTIPNSVTNIGNVAFANTKLTEITIPDSVVNLGQSAFSGCSDLTSVVLGTNVTSILENAFSGCGSLASITIPNSVTSIGDFAFMFAGLTNVTIGNGVANIGASAFASCGSLANLTIPDSVLNIENSAFESCSSLVSVMIGNGVTNIGPSAFQGCWNLTSVTVGKNVASMGGSFDGPRTMKVYFEGNRPAGVFSSGSVYYLPGTTGWGASYWGIPTSVWQPEVQSANASFGVQTNQFGFKLKWASGMTVVVEATP